MKEITQHPKISFKLCDEQGNQLYSPYDKEGKAQKTECKIVFGKDNFIPLPANYNGNTYSDFEAGVYTWYLVPINPPSEFEETRIPIEVEIRDFKEWDVLTPIIYPNGDILVKIKDFQGNIPQSTNLLTPNATYDNTTGIITYPNRDIMDLSVGHHTQLINQENNCYLSYEIKNPIHFYKTAVINGVEEDIDTYLSNETDYYKVGCKIYDDCQLLFNKSSDFIVTINGVNINSPVTYIEKAGTKNANSLPPGIYDCTCTTTLSNGTQYTCTETFEITTEGCNILLTTNTDYVDISSFFTLTAEYKYEDQPIPNATIGFFTDNNILKNISTTDSEGKAYFTGNKKGTYVAKVLTQNTPILISEPCTIYGMRYFMDGRIDVDEDLEVDLYTGEYNDRDLVNDISIDGNKDLGFKIEMNEVEDDVIVDAYLDDNGDLVFSKYGDLPQYLAFIELSEDGKLIASTSPAKYDTAYLINNITIDNHGVLKITSEINQFEKDILKELNITENGNLIYKRMND